MSKKLPVLGQFTTRYASLRATSTKRGRTYDTRRHRRSEKPCALFARYRRMVVRGRLLLQRLDDAVTFRFATEEVTDVTLLEEYGPLLSVCTQIYEFKAAVEDLAGDFLDLLEDSAVSEDKRDLYFDYANRTEALYQKTRLAPALDALVDGLHVLDGRFSALYIEEA